MCYLRATIRKPTHEDLLAKSMLIKTNRVVNRKIMNLKPYPKYKDSGIEWLGEIPEGWEVIPLRRIGKIVNGSTPESSNKYAG